MRLAVALAGCVAVNLFLWPALGTGQSVPTLTLARDLRIDANEQDLSRINWMAVARNGTIAVSQFQDRRVAFFDARGQPLGTFGRNGEGPGEFRNLAAYGWLGDTLLVSDASTRRLTLISPERTLVRTMPRPTTITFDSTLVPAPEFVSLNPRALYADGSMLVSARLAGDSPPIPWPTPAREGMPVMRIRSEGAFQRFVAWVPEGACTVAVSMSGRSGVVAIPLCAVPLTDFAPDGRRVAVATAEDVGEHRGFCRVLVVGERGDTLFNRRYEFGPVAIPKRVADSAIAASTSGGVPPELAAAYRSMKLPASFPPLDRVLLGRDETTWIEHFTLAGNRTWSMLDARGEPIGWLVVPRNIRIQQATRGAIWATEANEDGLQHIVRFRVTGGR